MKNQILVKVYDGRTKDGFNIRKKDLNTSLIIREGKGQYNVTPEIVEFIRKCKNRVSNNFTLVYYDRVTQERVYEQNGRLTSFTDPKCDFIR